MLKGQNVICFANDWASDPTSKHQVMRVLSEHNRILWVNSIGLRRPTTSASDLKRIWQKMRGFWKGLEVVGPNMYVLTPLVLPFPASAMARRLNAIILRLMLRFYIRRLSMAPVQLWTFMPTMVDLAGQLGETALIYYCVDEWSAFSFLDPGTMRALETRLLQRSDLVITSADALFEAKKRWNPNTYLVSHGVDSQHFARAQENETPIPPDVAALPQPLIGFWGLIHEWIDLELIERIAEVHPEWSVVLIGKAGVNCDGLSQYPNIHLLGQRQYSLLPGYAKAFAAAMVPFKVNRLTMSVNPIKLREYLAAGLQVVSTDLPEVNRYAKVVHKARTSDEFIALLEDTIANRDLDVIHQCMEAVRDETWTARVEHISGLVEKHCERVADR